MKIVFCGYNSLLFDYVNAVASQYETIVLVNRARPVTVPASARTISVDYFLFGIQKIVSFLQLQTTLPFAIRNLRHILTKENPDVLIVSDFYKISFIQAVRYCRQHPRCRLYVYSETQQWPKHVMSRLVMYLFFLYFKHVQEHIRAVLVFTDRGKQFLQQRSSVRILVAPVPIHAETFFPNSHKIFLENTVFRIIMNARFVPYKDHETLLNALCVLKQKGVSCMLTLLSTGGYLQKHILKLVRQKGLEHQVVFFPPLTTSEVREQYCQNDILVLPSRNEAIGMVVPEAMACGIPTLTSDTVGANVYVKDTVTGYVFKTGDAQDLSRKLILMFNRDQLQHMGRHAYNHITRHFTPEVLKARFLAILGLMYL